MRDVAEAVLDVQKEISREKGDFLLAALVLRDRSQSTWDLLLSAFWFPTKRKETLQYIVDKLRKRLSKRDFLRISKIVLLDPADPFVMAVTTAITASDGITEVVDCTFNEIEIAQMYLMASQRPIPAKS